MSLLQLIKQNANIISKAIASLWLFLFVFSTIYIVRNIEFRYELENFFPKSDSSIIFYQHYYQQFDNDYDVILLALPSDKSIYNYTYCLQVKKLQQKLQTSPFVDKIWYPFNLVHYTYSDFSFKSIPYLHVNDSLLIQKDFEAINQKDLTINNFISKDKKAFLLMIYAKKNLTAYESKSLIQTIKQEANVLGFYDIKMAGRPQAQSYISAKMQKEFILLAILTIVTLSIIIYWNYRSITMLILCAMVVTLGLVFTLFTMLFLGYAINIVSIILPNILFVVGVSDSVHVFNGYIREVHMGKSKIEALLITIKEIGLSTFLTAITAAIGFFTLITVNVNPIKEFGIFSAIGILIIFVISFTLLPALLYLLPPPKNVKSSHAKFFNIEKLYAWVNHREKKILLSIALFLIPMLFFTNKIEINNFFTEELRNNDKHKKEYQYFDEQFGGVRPLEISIKLKNKTDKIYSKEIVQSIDSITTYLKNVYEVQGIISSNDLVLMIHNTKSALPINNTPIDSIDFNFIKDHWHLIESMNESKRVINANSNETRIIGHIKDLGANEVEHRNEMFYNYIKQNKLDTKLELTMTGIGTIIDKNNKYLTDNLMFGLIWELLAIAIIIGLLFQSFSIGVIALIPNILPLLFIAALMGLFGIHLNLSSSILFNIAFGICVDDTIHLLGAYKVQLQKGLSKEQALYTSFVHSGNAITTTSLILMSGFIIMLISQFQGIFNTGLLVSITLIFACISDLMLIPILVRHLHKVKVIEN